MSLVSRKLGSKISSPITPTTPPTTTPTTTTPTTTTMDNQQQGGKIQVKLKKKDGIHYHHLPYFEHMTLPQLKEKNGIKQRLMANVSKTDKPKKKGFNHIIARTTIMHSDLFQTQLEKIINYDVVLVYENENSPPLFTFLCIMTHMSYWQNMDTARVAPLATFEGVFDVLVRGDTSLYFIYDENTSSTQDLFQDTIKERLTSERMLKNDDVVQLELLEKVVGLPLFHTETPILQEATHKKAKKIMLYLLKHEKCPKNYINQEDFFGRTALSRAEGKEMVEILLENGADPFKKNRSGNSFLVELATGLIEIDEISSVMSMFSDEDAKKLCNMQNKDGETVLHALTQDIFDKPSIINYLIGLGADPTIKNKEGQRPIDKKFRNNYNKDAFKKPYKRKPLSNSQFSNLKKFLLNGNSEEIKYYINEGFDVWQWGKRGTLFGDVLSDNDDFLTKKEQRDATFLLFSHPDCPHNYFNWKGGWVKLDPISQIRTLEGIQFLIDINTDLSRESTFSHGTLLTCLLKNDNNMQKDPLLSDKISLICCNISKMGGDVGKYIRLESSNFVSALETARENCPETTELLLKFADPNFDFKKYEKEEQERKEKEERERIEEEQRIEEERRKKEEEEREKERKKREEQNKRIEQAQKKREREETLFFLGVGGGCFLFVGYVAWTVYGIVEAFYSFFFG